MQYGYILCIRFIIAMNVKKSNEMCLFNFILACSVFGSLEVCEFISIIHFHIRKLMAKQRQYNMLRKRYKTFNPLTYTYASINLFLSH